MSALWRHLRWEVVLQARNGFYWAGAFVVMALSALLTSLPEAVRHQAALGVPALVAMNLQMTTFFFVVGLLLLDRDEGTLVALGVSPFSAANYLTAKIITLTGLAAMETTLLIWVGFGLAASWLLLLTGMVAMSVTYTAIGVIVGARYDSVNAMLLPASVVITFLLLPLLSHFGFASDTVLAWHPLSPSLSLMRAAYAPGTAAGITFAAVGAAIWMLVSCVFARTAINRLMHDTRATGGR